MFDQILVMLHPFMPFVTEELWHAMGERPYDLIVAKWPMPDARSARSATPDARDRLADPPGQRQSARHARRAQHPAGRQAAPACRRRDAADEPRPASIASTPTLPRLARLESIQLSTPSPAGGAAQIVVDEATFVLPLEGVIDLDAEKARLAKAVAAAEKERDSLAARLANPAFVERAKPEAVEKARADHDEKAAEAGALSGRAGAARSSRES